jgi:hypothetical protein
VKASTICFALVVSAVSAGVAAEDWRSARDQDFEYRYSYPPQLFASVESDRPSFHYFASQREDAKFMVGAWDNSSGQTPAEFKRWMLDNAAGYEDITYQPGGRSWFVLSGFRGDQIYYEKIMFSCGGRVANVLAITYPESRRYLFDPVVERMEDHFRPGRPC